MGANISAWRGDGGSQESHSTDANGNSSAPAAAAPVDPGSLYFGTRLFVSQPRHPEEDGDEEAGSNPAAASADGELSALEVLRRVNNTAPFHQTKTLNCPINLKKQSLSLIAQSSENKQQYSVQFMFDSCTSCAISVFYACVEVYDKDNHTFKFVIYLKSFLGFNFHFTPSLPVSFLPACTHFIGCWFSLSSASHFWDPSLVNHLSNGF